MRKQNLRYLSAFIIVAILSVSFTSCDKDDEESSKKNSLIGWYVVDDSPTMSALDRGKMSGTITSGKYDRSDFFRSDGSFIDGINGVSAVTYRRVIRIIDNTTLLYYDLTLYDDGAGKGDKLYTIYGGQVIGSLAYYADSPSYYTYIQIGNKITLSTGTIYTIVDEGLIREGSSDIYKKYK